MTIAIAGFSAQDKVPGAVGEVVYGVSGQSAASAPVSVLLVGLKGSSGDLTEDTEVRQIFSYADIDRACEPGSELALQGYAAVDVSGQSGPPVYIAAPKAAGGAVAASGQLAIGGTWTSGGQINIRIAGKIVQVGVTATNAATEFGSAIAAAINGANGGRLPISATATTGKVALAWKTAGIRGDQAIVHIDVSQLPSGCTATLTGPVWVTLTTYTTGAFVVPVTANGYYFKATTGGTAGAPEPTWPTTIGSTVTDGTVTWTCWGKVLPGNGVTLGGGSGTETYTNLLATLLNARYRRIALAANDATSEAAWKTQIDNQAAAPSNLLQHAVCCQNDTLTSATSLAQTTLNEQRFQVLWARNGESFPAETAARVATMRAAAESSDPDAAYNFAPIPGAAPMVQDVDIPSRSELITALNAGVTPLTTTNKDGVLRIVRSVTSHSLLGSEPDYSTSDTGEAVTPDFILDDLKDYWASVFAPANPRVQDDPAPGEKLPPEGVAYPSLWESTVQGKMMDYAKATATREPIVKQPQPGDIVADFDPISNRIMLAVTSRVMPNNAQVGISVRQSAQ